MNFKNDNMIMWAIVLAAFMLFWASLFLSDFILKKVRRSKMIGLLLILLALVIAFEFYPANKPVAGLSVFVAFTGARVLMK